ncbi:MAG: DUF1697 domain-containing protein [Acidimicrobiales bacterium]
MSNGTRFFVFLRAINIGPKRLTNDELIEPFVRLGLDDVNAFQAAGNITFRCDDPRTAQPNRLEAALADAYGFATLAFVRSRDELVAIADAPPFTDDELAETEGRTQVSFLQEEPNEDEIEAVLALVPPTDLVRFTGRDWLWLPKKDISDSRLPVATIGEILGPTTMRTLGTISRMLTKFDP